MILISDEHKIVWPEVEIEVKDGLDVYPFYNDEMSAIIENLIWKEEFLSILRKNIFVFIFPICT